MSNTLPSPWNVRLLICAQLFIYFVQDFPLGALFDVYLLELGSQHNVFVGAVEGFRGCVKLALALPLGALSDYGSKRGLLRANCLIGAFFLVCFVVAVSLGSTAGLFVMVTVWALHSQAHDGTALAFLTDCTQEGQQRTKGVANLQAAAFLGRALAPAVQVPLIHAYGANSWGHERLKHILMFGLVAELGVCIPCALLRKPRVACGEVAEGDSRTVELTGTSEAAHPRTADRGEAANWKEEVCLGVRKCVLVPWLLELTQIVVMFGSGCSVKFLPLFFKSDFGFSPSQVCMMMAALGFGTAFYGLVVPAALTRLMGRARAAFATHLACNVALYVFCFLRDWRAALTLYVLRYSAMNSTTQLSAALVMDTVDSSSRGRWAGIVSLKAGVWSGTALLGGMLADATGDYRAAFLATAVAHSAAALVLFPVLWLVPRGY